MNAPLRILIVDDERSARKLLRSFLAGRPGIELVGEAATIAEAVTIATRERPELVLLDVQMPPATGFDLLPLLPSPAPAIVFVTAHDRFAVRAFEVSAIDYLLKPVSADRLTMAVERVRAARPAVGAEPEPAKAAERAALPLQNDETLILRDDHRVRRVRVEEIAAIEADGHYTRVHLANEAAMFVLRGINTWAVQLPAPEFLRVDRSLIVNLARVRALNVESRESAMVVLDTATPVSLALGRSASARLLAALRS